MKMPNFNFFKGFKAKKPQHPQECACCLSRLFFCWTIPSFVKGFRKIFTESDLFPPLKSHEAGNLGNKLEEEWNLEYFKSTKPSLLRVLIKIFGKKFYKYGFLMFFMEFMKLLQPISMYKLMTSFTAKKKLSEHPMDFYVYTSTLLLSIFINVICAHQYTFGLQRLGLKMKTACNSLIYKKCLRLSNNAANKSTAGQIVNLISNDLNRFDKLFIHLHYIWITPIQACVVMYLLYSILHPSGMVGVGLFFLFIPLQMIIGKKYSQFRLKTARKTDERVRLINEIVSGIQVIKMYTWEDLFIKLANTARKEEIRYVCATSYLKASQKCFNRYLSKCAVFLCILTYVLTGNAMKSQYVFVIKSFYIILKESMTTFFPESIKNLAEALVSVKRLQNFLMSEETTYKNTNPAEKTDHMISLSDVCAKWASSSSLDTLEKVNFSASSGQLVTIFGTVGSGKSSLISVILRELPILKGKLEISGKISYAAQEPWLFAGTIRENILFGQKLDYVKYREVIKACALDIDFESFPHGDCSIIGDRGVTLSGGQKARINLARAIYKEADIYLLDDPLSALDACVAKQIFSSCLLNYLKEKCVVLLTHQLQFLERSDVIYFMRNGKVVISGDYEHLKNSGQEFAMLLKEEMEHEDLDNVSDDFNDILSLSFKEEDGKKTKESQNFGEVSWQTYKKYLFSGGCCTFSLLVAFFVTSQVLHSFMDYFEAYWVDLQQNRADSSFIRAILPFVDVDNCVFIYAGLMLVILIFAIITSISFYAYFTRTSIKMHHTMFSAIIKATVTFFYTHPSGAILNRFSKDIASIDLNIPKLLQDTIQTGLEMLAAVSVISIVNPWMALVSVPLIFLFYMLRRFYLSTTRELKRIDCITRSPVFSHLNQTLQGLETIRAFGVQENLKRQFDNHLNRNVSAFYMFLACSSTFGFWLDMVCVIYIAIVTTTSFWDSSISGAEIGLIITQSMGLTNMLQWGMTQWSEFETEMTSVERVIEYTEIEPECDNSKNGSVTKWDNSTIEFKKVCLKYKNDGPCVLNDLDFKINPKEKIGIVGRTGAGKSSIISALFRLVKFDGKVSIGGVDIDKIPLNISRSKISIIPQEPVLFSGTVRENLDPYNEFHDSKIWQILEELDLKYFVANLPSGLESKISEKGDNLSVGQKQLFCLARALLRENKILVLDEATANVDFKTDALIQSTIKTKFSKCTVLIIAHRLHTIIDCDKILVMDAGKVVEFDHPYKLLEKEDGALYSLVLKTGRSMLEFLKEIARENYANSHPR